MRTASALDAIAPLRSGMSLFLHGTSATPTPLLEAICQRDDLRDLTIYHLHLCGPVPFADARFQNRFHSVSLFTGPALRNPVEEGRADYIPVFLSDIPHLFRSKRIKLDAMLLQVSPPDQHGNCTLGTAVEAARAGTDAAPILIAEINEQMPRTHGDSLLPLKQLTSWYHSNRPLYETPAEVESEVEARIGEHISHLVDDGSCLQLGIGGIPNAVLSRLLHKHDLGIHTEMFSDQLVELVEAGVVTNRMKSIYPHRIVTSFVIGTQRLFRFVDDNPQVEFHPCDHTNDTSLIRRLDKLVAINSALQVDLSGQVCADSIGHRIYSGFGGQVDFIRGAALSPGGKPIIALPATARQGAVSRIVPELSPGAGVVTTRAHVHWVVTEHGAVNLHGLTLRQRGEALTSIADPIYRNELLAWLRGVKHWVI